MLIVSQCLRIFKHNAYLKTILKFRHIKKLLYLFVRYSKTKIIIYPTGLITLAVGW